MRARWRFGLAIACIAGSLACDRAQPARVRPDVVLITIDTLRADHVSSYGYARDTTPALDRLARDSVVFESASSSSSWTAPAMASLFTSLYPPRHGVRDGLVPTMFLDGSTEVYGQPVLGADFVTLAEALRDLGYRTLGFSTNPHLTRELGFAQGFDVYESLAPERPQPAAGLVYTDASEVVKRVAARIDAERAAGPLFLWVHFLDPHIPLFARAPWANEYRREVGIAPEAFPRVRMRTPDESPGDLDPESFRRLLLALYDSEIRFLDDRIATLLERLAPSPESLIVVTSDHGESFFDHGVFGHSHSLYQSELHIPLIIRFPASMDLRGRIAAPVSLADVGPTILDVVTAGAQPAMVGDGQSLVPLARETGRDVARPVFATLRRGKLDMLAVRQDRWKLVWDRQRETRELYDVPIDPHEEQDRSASEPQVARELGAALDAFARETDAAPRAPMHPLDAEAMQKLRALGYAR